MKQLAAVVLAIVLVNVAIRLLPLPDVDLPSIDIPDWIGTALKVKNWIIGGVIAVVVLLVAIDEVRKARARSG